MILIKMQKSFLVIFEVFLRLNSDLLDMISCFVTAVKGGRICPKSSDYTNIREFMKKVHNFLLEGD